MKHHYHRLFCLSVACALALLLSGITQKPSLAEESGSSIVLSKEVKDEIENYHVTTMVLLAVADLKTCRDREISDAAFSEYVAPFRPLTLRAYQDLKFDDPLVPAKSQSYEEKLYLKGYPSDEFYSLAERKMLLLPLHLAFVAARQYQDAGFTSPDLAWMSPFESWDLYSLSHVLALRISPVTGELISPYNKEKSAGNAYVRVITDKEIEALCSLDPSIGAWLESGREVSNNSDADAWIATRWSELLRPIWDSTPETPIVVYIRLYGLDGVLLEGLYKCKPCEYYPCGDLA